jgi:hypothetical protein
MRSTKTVAMWAGLAFCAVAIATGARGAEAVKFEKEPVKVEVKYFDPKHLPDPPPPIEKGESAVTVYELGIETYVRYGYVEPKPGTRPVKVDFTISQVSVKLKCGITEWLPENAPAALRAHEEGHRAIAEAFYKRGEAVARRLAAKEAGRTVVGHGEDAKEAGNAAIQEVTGRVNGGYTKGIIEPCKAAQEKFDTITAHGTNGKDAKEAVKEVTGK